MARLSELRLVCLGSESIPLKFPKLCVLAPLRELLLPAWRDVSTAHKTRPQSLHNVLLGLFPKGQSEDWSLLARALESTLHRLLLEDRGFPIVLRQNRD